MPLHNDGCRPAKVAKKAQPLASAGGSYTGRDHISELPDDILGSILFLLPLKEAGRTTTLSKRWSGVFKISPISLDDAHFVQFTRCPSKEAALRYKAVAVINRILKEHMGPVQCVRLVKTHFQGNGYGQGIDTKAFEKRGMEELIVRSTNAIQFFPAPPLRSLQVIRCDWFAPEQPMPATFAHIKELSLRAVKFSVSDLVAVLEHCVALESLLLSSFHKNDKDAKIGRRPLRDACRTLPVRSQSLRSLSLELVEMEEVVIVDARLLGQVSFEYFKLTLINAPKLQILGFLNMQIPSYTSMSSMYLELSRLIHSVKILGLCLELCDIACVQKMLNILKYFPCLETLNIKILSNHTITHTLYSEGTYTNFLHLAEHIDCLRDSVRTIVMNEVYLERNNCGLQFLKMLLESAKKLQLMKIFHIPVNKKKQARSTRRKLDLKSHPSIKARLIFPRDYDISRRQVSDVLMDASSLTVSDPFFYPRTFLTECCAREDWRCYGEWDLVQKCGPTILQDIL
ncbi:hypothetical protein BS78_09G208700 [Paspalum vaginatum]|nr:hypothetical protein BS78_09G208700 [Paspalum vaginatum]